MLIEDNGKNIKKNSEEELGNYFNFKEYSKFVSTTSTEPSDDQLVSKVGY